jgi:alpha-tubulin suppressor-like RCC1 family protein
MRNRTRAALSALSSLLASLSLAACGIGTSTASPTVADHANVYTFGVVASPRRVARLEHFTPRLVPGIRGTVVQIATSNAATYALTSDGSVWAWGAGSQGELGNGSTAAVASTAVKVQFRAGVKITSLANPMPYNAALAIDSSGHVWGWGFNAGHDLCLPGFSYLLHPRRLPLADVSLATGAGTHSLFDSTGTVYACGTGLDGQLGNGTARTRAIPTAVIGLPAGGVKELTASWQGSGALMDDGAYYDWGYNAAGQLGDGSKTNRFLPVRVRLSAPVLAVSQGGSTFANGQTLAVLADGSLWAWGDGRWGQLGDGRMGNSSLPVRVKLPNGVRAVKVSSGGSSCYVIATSGQLWAWGRNEYGELGRRSISTTQLKPIDLGIVLAQVSSTATNVAGLATR